MSRRLVTDAKIVLEKAGYHLECFRTVIYVDEHECGPNALVLIAEKGTVDNQDVIDLLARRGFDEYGRKI